MAWAPHPELHAPLLHYFHNSFTISKDSWETLAHNVNGAEIHVKATNEKGTLRGCLTA